MLQQILDHIQKMDRVKLVAGEHISEMAHKGKTCREIRQAHHFVFNSVMEVQDTQAKCPVFPNVWGNPLIFER